MDLPTSSTEMSSAHCEYEGSSSSGICVSPPSPAFVFSGLLSHLHGNSHHLTDSKAETSNVRL